MAVVKVKYVRAKPQIKAHLRYIVHRRGGEEHTITRPLFNHEGKLSKAQVYALINSARRGAVFYKFMLNLHPTREDRHKDLDLWELTRKTLGQVHTRFGPVPFIATIHNDHTPLRHVHGFFLVPGRLSYEEFSQLKGLWKIASTEAFRQRRLLDRVRDNPRLLRLGFVARRYQTRARGIRHPLMQAECNSCGFGRFTGISRFRLYCPSCHKRLDRAPALRLRLGGRR